MRPSPYGILFIGTWVLIQLIDISINLTNPMNNIEIVLLKDKCPFCRNPTLKECEDDTHTPEMGTWESSRIPENS
jgi:hypothetical protein